MTVRNEPGGEKQNPGSPDDQSGIFTREGVSRKLSRTTEKLANLQSRFSIQGSQQTAPVFQAIQDQLAKAAESIESGNYAAADAACNIADARIGELFSILLNRNAMNRNPASGNGTDSTRLKQDQRNGAQMDFERSAAKLNYYSHLLASGKHPCASEAMDKVRDLLDHANAEIRSDRPEGARTVLTKVEPLFLELQRQLQESHAAENQRIPEASRNPCQDQQSARVAFGQAQEIQRRVQERATRLNEQNRPATDAKVADAMVRIQDLLDKSKDALAGGHADAAKEYALKAEVLLAEMHRAVSVGDARLSPATWQRLKAKLDRASEIVAASGNDKAGKILEKAKEHLERAERSHAEGQSSRAEVEMDLALKLAAKSVDISRSGTR
ncbi:MAG: hypothetical protein ABIW76_14095 [Fibrobacteria bacterium]